MQKSPPCIIEIDLSLTDICNALGNFATTYSGWRETMCPPSQSCALWWSRDLSSQNPASPSSNPWRWSWKLALSIHYMYVQCNLAQVATPMDYFQFHSDADEEVGLNSSVSWFWFRKSLKCFFDKVGGMLRQIDTKDDLEVLNRCYWYSLAMYLLFKASSLQLLLFDSTLSTGDGRLSQMVKRGSRTWRRGNFD